LITEHLVVVVVATVVGVGLAQLILGVLRDVAILQSLRPVGMEYRLDAPAVGFAVALALVIALILSLVPVRLLRRTDIQSVLRLGAPTAGGGGWGRGGRGAQRVFVVLQLAAAVVLLTGAALMTKTVLRLSRLDLGFESGQLLDGTPSFPHPWRVKEKYLPVTRQIVTELGVLPGVDRVAVRATVPLGPRGSSTSITLEGQASPLPLALVPPAAVAVDTGYFKTLGVALVQGRAFGPADVENGPPVAIVNQWAAERWWPGQNPVGKVIRVDTAPSATMALEIVGVAHDNRAAQPGLLLAQQAAEVYRPLEQAPSAFPSFVIRARGSVTPLLKPVKETLARLVPDRPLFATPVADQASQQLASVRINAYQILGFALVGLMLAILGVYGVLAYAVGRRTQEIGIRGALGASRVTLSRMVVVDGLRLAGIGILIGLPTAALAAQSLTAILYGTRPADPLVLATVAAAVFLVAAAASWLPARRASRVDPLVALRTG
jgi:predicted permease